MLVGNKDNGGNKFNGMIRVRLREKVTSAPRQEASGV